MISNENMNRFDSLREQALAFSRQGANTEALELCDQALALAHEFGKDQLVDRAICNRAAVLVSMDRGEEVISQLRALLLRTADLTSRHFAAYNIARFYEYERNAEKGIFYAKIAVESARSLDRPEWVAGSLNQLGNFQIRQSYFADASACYQESLSTLKSEPSNERSMVLSNLGYAMAMQGKHREALSLLLQSLRAYRRIGHSLMERIPRLDLCFTYLEMGRYQRAIRHGLAALSLAEEAEDNGWIKNCLYLLGEGSKLSGNHFLARQYFSRLQSEYFPGQEFIPEILLSMDVRGLVNLRA